MRLPRDQPARGLWLAKLGLDNEDSRKDARVSASHFSQHSLVASKVGSGPGGASVTVGLVEGALPTVSNEDMMRAMKGSLGRLLRCKAVTDRHAGALVLASCKIAELEAKIVRLESDAGVRNEMGKPGAKGDDELSRLRGIDVGFLIGKNEDTVRSLTGLSSHASLQVRLLVRDVRSQCNACTLSVDTSRGV